jgi:hypothetical protein
MVKEGEKGGERERKREIKKGRAPRRGILLM